LLEEKSQIDSNLKNSLSLNENLQHELKLVQADFSDLKQKITLYEKALDKVKFINLKDKVFLVFTKFYKH